MSDNSSLRGREVLLVEDNMDDAFLFNRAIKELFPDSSVSAVADAKAATRFLTAGRHDTCYLPAAIFVDLQLPGKSGSELLHWIEHEPHLGSARLFVLSGDIAQCAQTTTSSGRDVVYLPKPLTSATMAEAVLKTRTP